MTRVFSYFDAALVKYPDAVEFKRRQAADLLNRAARILSELGPTEERLAWVVQDTVELLRPKVNRYSDRGLKG